MYKPQLPEFKFEEKQQFTIDRLQGSVIIISDRAYTKEIIAEPEICRAISRVEGLIDQLCESTDYLSAVHSLAKDEQAKALLEDLITRNIDVLKAAGVTEIGSYPTKN